MESCSHAENKSCIWAIKCFHGRAVLAKILTYSKTPASFPPLRPHTQLVNWSQFYFHSCPLSLRFPQCSLTLISPICTCFHLFPFPPIPYWPLTLLLSSPVSLRIPKGFGLLASIVCSRGGGRLRASHAFHVKKHIFPCLCTMSYWNAQTSPTSTIYFLSDSSFSWCGIPSKSTEQSSDSNCSMTFYGTELPKCKQLQKKITRLRWPSANRAASQHHMLPVYWGSQCPINMALVSP